MRYLARVLGLPAPTLQYWVNLSLVTPDERRKGRAGHAIGLDGLLEAVTVLELRNCGFSMHKIREAIEKLRRMSKEDRPLARLLVVVIGNDIVWQIPDSDVQVSALRQPNQRLLILPVGEQYENVKQHLSQEVIAKTALSS